MLIPRQPRQPSIYDVSRSVICQFNPWIQSINYILALAIFVTYSFYDFKANSILNDENQKSNINDLHSKYGYDFTLELIGWVCWSIYSITLLMSMVSRCIYYRLPWRLKPLILVFICDILTACLNIPFTFPYLKDKIIGPGYQIISCNRKEPTISWKFHWCALHEKLVVLAWLSIFVWFLAYLFYIFIVLIVISERIYNFLRLWFIYQYQYRKGLFLTWLKERKEKRLKLQNHIIPDKSKDSIKSNNSNNENHSKNINDIKIVVSE
ncbi:hypothetical protein C2G38_195890 [Gigaspora rosea]|uniref:Uncharacterized protein n=1 Tax=Gigaspora rosea TaxID=44941 RepID=A0A397VY56_9GLOM|nr:hypothetical protein C2G38_195890 [Gigaspora rosea]